MKKKLDTIQIHGLNLVIIFGLFMLYAFINRNSYLTSILALSQNVNSDTKKFEDLNYKLKLVSDKNKTTIKVDEERLAKQMMAMSAIIYDATDGKVIWSHNSSKPSSLASLTKVMTAYVYKEVCDKDILFGGLTFKSDDAIRFMLIQSSNDMAEALASNCMKRSEFIKSMNNKAIDMKLSLHFSNPSGMDYPGVIGGRGDAISVSQLLYQASDKYPEIFDYTTEGISELKVSRSGKLAIVEAVNTNQHISNVTGARASKTGLTDYAGGNLGIVYDPFIGKTLSLIVLGSTKEGRFEDINLLLNSIKIEQNNI